MRANIVLCFAVSGAISFATYAVAGLLVRETFAMSLLIAPAYGLGLFVGARMFGIASEETFRRLCYWLIALAALLSLPVLDGLLR